MVSESEIVIQVEEAVVKRMIRLGAKVKNRWQPRPVITAPGSNGETFVQLGTPAQLGSYVNIHRARFRRYPSVREAFDGVLLPEEVLKNTPDIETVRQQYVDGTELISGQKVALQEKRRTVITNGVSLWARESIVVDENWKVYE